MAEIPIDSIRGYFAALPALVAAGQTMVGVETYRKHVAALLAALDAAVAALAAERAAREGLAKALRAIESGHHEWADASDAGADGLLRSLCKPHCPACQARAALAAAEGGNDHG